MNKKALKILKIGIAFALVYPAIVGLLEPATLIEFIPSFVETYMPIDRFLVVFSVAQLLLGFWILFGKKVGIPALLTTLLLAALVFFNRDNFTIVFRDLALAFAALSLAVASLKKKDDV